MVLGVVLGAMVLGVVLGAVVLGGLVSKDEKRQ
jgi:hypothetical protein